MVLEKIEEMKSEAVTFFQKMIGTTDEEVHFTRAVLQTIFSKSLTNAQQNSLQAEGSSQEIKQALFSLQDNKAPSPDGFTAHFFKKAWHIVGDSVILAVKTIFLTGHLPRQLNSTIISLVPKKDNCEFMKDYRPISCCNVL